MGQDRCPGSRYGCAQTKSEPAAAQQTAHADDAAHRAALADAPETTRKR